jgi:hypothetical protein
MRDEQEVDRWFLTQSWPEGRFREIAQRVVLLDDECLVRTTFRSSQNRYKILALCIPYVAFVVAV